MAFLDQIPMPQFGSTILAQGTQNLLQRLLDQRRAANELAETSKYHQGSLDIQKQEQDRLAKEFQQKQALEVALQPLKLNLLKAQIAAQNSLAKERDMGLDRYGSAGLKDIYALKNQIKLDKKVDDQTANDLANRALAGEDVGLSGISKNLVDQIIKRGTTANVVSQGVKAVQSEAEIDALNKFAQEGLRPYGNTILGFSPEQIMDTFKDNPESQKKLGRFIASQGLQYEIAQNRIRLAQGQPGVTSTQELMDMAQQRIKTMYPKLSQAAREEASDYMDKALVSGLKARRKVGSGASLLLPQNEKSESSNIPRTKWKIENGQLVEDKS